MSDTVQMPALGESVTEGTVTRWLKQVGERVEVDEPLLEVSTDKVDTEIPSPSAGVVEQILVAEDETVKVGAPLAVIGSGVGGASAPAAAAPVVASPAPPAEAPPAVHASPAPAVAQPAASAPPAAGGNDTPITMPALGESVTEGTVTRWLKQVGDQVKVDEPLLEVSTDKVDTEIPSPISGTLSAILVAEDETVPVGARLAMVGGAASSSAAASAPVAAPAPPAPVAAPPAPPAAPPAPPAAPPAPVAAPPAPVASAPVAAPIAAAPAATAPSASSAEASAAALRGSQSIEGSAYVTPLVRKMAAERGVDLSKVTGTGVGGRIRKQDVVEAADRQAAAAAASAPASAAPARAAAVASSVAVAASASALRGQTVKMTRLRKVIATRMVESLQVAAQLTTVVEVDVTKISKLRDRAKKDFLAREGVKLSFMPFFAVAVVEALKQYPMLNATIDGDQITYFDEENLGVAVDTDRGLLVPVIHGAGGLNLAGIARSISDLADRTRNNKVTPDELGGGTFTLTNTGSRGALFDTPIINLPQTGILGTGTVVRRPMVVTDMDGGETIAIRSMVYLALSYDHRIVDGADAARFLSTMKARLEEGAFEADLGL